MTLGLIGEKCGMTRIFTDEGVSIPVSVVSIPPNRIVQVKSQETDGYDAIQVTYGQKKASRINKAMTGHFAKSKVEAGKKLYEFPVSDGDKTKNEGLTLDVGCEINVELFNDTKFVDVTGVSKGKGYAGVIKRHNFRGQDSTHGNSKAHRLPGSLGQCQTPGRVFKGKKMSGQMGNKQCTSQNLELVKVDAERNLLFIKGAVPGFKTGVVVIKPAVKKSEG